MDQVRDWGDDGAEIKAYIVKEVLRNAVGPVGWIDDIAWLVASVAGPWQALSTALLSAWMVEPFNV